MTKSFFKLNGVAIKPHAYVPTRQLRTWNKSGVQQLAAGRMHSMRNWIWVFYKFGPGAALRCMSKLMHSYPKIINLCEGINDRRSTIITNINRGGRLAAS